MSNSCILYKHFEVHFQATSIIQQLNTNFLFSTAEKLMHILLQSMNHINCYSLQDLIANSAAINHRLY
uniref:Uncharacterized protein n=1 Tax=Rhizophora mucronata TaxID=61149 RepID=A0A2P2NLH7_RHIMU